MEAPEADAGDPWGVAGCLWLHSSHQRITEQHSSFPHVSEHWAWDYLLFWDEIWDQMYFVCVFSETNVTTTVLHGTEHLWIGDPGTLRHPIGSCHCSVPPPPPPPPRSIAISLLLLPEEGTADLLCPSCTGPDWTIAPTLSAAFVGHLCFRCGSEPEEEVEEETGGFLCYCLVLKGRSQLLILRCKEKAPCREVRYRLRNRN